MDPPGGGPSRLIVCAVLRPDATAAPRDWTAEFQKAIRDHLNPLFRVHAVNLVESLPRTASNKVMRRLLRKQYQA